MAKAIKSSEAVVSSTTPASPMYSELAVRLRRINSERMSPPRSRSQTASPVIRLEAARYQWVDVPRLPSAVKWSASSEADAQSSTASMAVRPNVNRNCTSTTSPVNFATYHPVAWKACP